MKFTVANSPRKEAAPDARRAGRPGRTAAPGERTTPADATRPAVARGDADRGDAPNDASARSNMSPTRPRRRPVLVAVGTLLILVAALASYLTFANLSNTISVVVTTGHIARGEAIEATDLGSMEIARGQVTSAITVAEAASIVGQYATVDLPPGSLITSATVQATLPIEPGMSIVGVAVTAGQLPSTGLTPGDRIRLVSTPVTQGEPPESTPESIDAVVFAVRPDERGGVVVDVLVPSPTAPDVAARAATGRIAIVLDGVG